VPSDRPPTFAVEVVVPDENQPVVAIHGEVDIATAPELRQQLFDIVDQHPSQIVLDLTDMGFIDCSGIAVIAAARAALPAQECEIILRAPNRLARKVFQLTGLDGPCMVVD
jgi:anti-sigma B factor antagonist